MPKKFDEKKGDFHINDFVRLRSIYYPTMGKQRFKSPQRTKSKSRRPSDIDVNHTDFFNILRVPAYFKSSKTLAMSFIIDPNFPVKSAREILSKVMTSNKI